MNKNITIVKTSFKGQGFIASEWVFFVHLKQIHYDKIDTDINEMSNISDDDQSEWWQNYTEVIASQTFKMPAIVSYVQFNVSEELYMYIKNQYQTNALHFVSYK